MWLTRDLHELLPRNDHDVARRHATQHRDDAIEHRPNRQHAGERDDEQQRGEEGEEKVIREAGCPPEAFPGQQFRACLPENVGPAEHRS
jgi:hypothetical protein